MSNDVSIYAPRDLAQSQQIAETLANSGLVPDVLRGKPAAVWAILALGSELGLPGPMAALSGIHVISGRPTPSPQTMLALCLRHPSCEFFTLVGTTDDAAEWVAKRRGAEPVHLTFTIEEAKRLGWASKDGWRKQPNVMLRWRAMAALARIVFPDVTMGLYTTDEVQDFDDRPAARVEPRTERPRATAAETVAKRAEMMRRGSAPPAAGVVEDAEVVRTGRDALADALTDCGITPADFDLWCAHNSRPVCANMDHTSATQAANWLLHEGGANRVRVWHADRAKAAPKAKVNAPAEPDAPHPDELQMALKDVGIPAALADAWAQHKGYKPATAAGARALWLSIMEPDGGEWSAFMAEWDKANPEAEAEAVPAEQPSW